MKSILKTVTALQATGTHKKAVLLLLLPLLLLCANMQAVAQCTATISTQPKDSTLCTGNNASFSIIATNTTDYQWQVSTNGGTSWADIVNGGVYSGATTTSLLITGAVIGMNNYQYRCQAINTPNTCSTASTAAVMLLDQPSTISSQPTNKTICSSTNTSFSVTAANVTSYQWQVSTNNGTTWADITNGGVYSNATTATLDITSATFAMNGYQYRCLLTAPCSVITNTNAVALTVNAPATFTAQPASQVVCPGTNTVFSCTATGSGTISYVWQVKNSGGTTWNNLSNGGIYSNVSTPNLTLTNIPLSMDNTQYRCVISGICPPADITTPATLNVYELPAITDNPQSITYCAGANVDFTCDATGAGITYQWQVSINGGVSFGNITNGGVYSNANTNTLNITSATAGMDNYYYRCLVSGTCPPAVATNVAILTLGELPSVTLQPVSVLACTGFTNTFTIAATGYIITYQWQVSINGGTTWSDVIDGGVYSNATTTSLSVTNPTVLMSGYQYRCVVTNGCAQSVNSDPATMTVAEAPVVITHPSNSTICDGDNTQYTVAATSADPITYQWQGSNNGTTWVNLINSSYYTGVTTTMLQLSNANSGAFSMYRCELNTGCMPFTTTNAATLTVETQPVISLNPSNRTICVAQSTVFQVGATGSNLSYQWQVSTNGGVTYNNVTNGGVYSGATTFNLTLTNVTVAYNNYSYRCVVSGSCPTAKTSAAGVLTVNVPVAITAQPTTAITLCSGDNTSLSISATGTGLSYRWYILSGSTYTALNDAGFYSGATTPTLTITGITAAPNTQTYTYRCIATGTCNAVTSNATYITVNAKPAIVNNPVSIARCDSSHNATFSVTATGTNVTYQWQISTDGGSVWTNLTNNSSYNNTTTSTLLLPSLFLTMDGYEYRCVVSGTCTPAATSAAATLTINPLITPSVTISASTTDICAGQSVVFSTSEVNGGSADYQWKKNNVNVGTGPTYTTTTLANNDIIICHMTSNATCPTPKVVVSNPITMKVTPNSTPTIAISSNVGNSWCIGKPIVFTASITDGGLNPTYVWKLNNVVIGGNTNSLALPFVNNGDKVVCSLVSSLRCFIPNPAVSNTITMTVSPITRSSVVIAANPDSIICDKTEVTLFTFFTNGGTTPAFQWMLNGADIPGETGGTLKTTALADGDYINCRFISNANCVFPEISNAITFKVIDLLDPKVDVSVSYNGNDSYTFTATSTNGGSNPSYQWYRNFNKLVGETGATYTSNILDKTDKIYVEMASSEPCVNPLLELVKSRNATTGVADLGTAFKELGLYPNPNTGQFTISGELNQPIVNKEVVVKITNALGQTVYSQVYPATGGNISLPVTLKENVANGMYTVNITIDNETTNIRFVISR